MKHAKVKQILCFQHHNNDGLIVMDMQNLSEIRTLMSLKRQKMDIHNTQDHKPRFLNTLRKNWGRTNGH